MAQPNDAGIGGGQLSAAERARREALRQSLLANAAKYAPAPTPRPASTGSATSSAAYDPLSSANTGKPVARKVGATIAPAPEEIVRQRRPAPAPVAPPKPSIPTVTARPSATSSAAYDPLSSANTGRRYTPTTPPEPPAAPPRLDIPSRGYSFTDGSYTGATPQQRAQEIDWAQMAAQATAQANAQRRQAEAQAPAQGFAGNGQVPFGMVPSPVVPLAGALALVPPAVNTLFRAVDANRQAENPFDWRTAAVSSPLTPALPGSAEGAKQYIADRDLYRRYGTPGRSTGAAVVDYERMAQEEIARQKEAAEYAAMGLPTTYMPMSEEEIQAIRDKTPWTNELFATGSRAADAAFWGLNKAISTLRIPFTERTDDQGNPIPDTGLNPGGGLNVMADVLSRAAAIGAAGNAFTSQLQFGRDPATIRSAEQQVSELVAPFAQDTIDNIEALRDVNLAIASASVPGAPTPGTGPEQGPQPKPATSFYDWYADVKRNHGIVPIGPKTLDQAIVVAQRDPNYMSPMSIDGINTAISDINRQAQLDLQTARRLAHVRPITQGQWSEETPNFYDALMAMGIVDGKNVPYAEMASVIASSGAEAQTRVLENFELKAELPKIRELRNQMLWSNTDQGMASALALSSLILKLESTPYSGLVDLETNLPMELLDNFLLDPLNFFDLPLGAVANANLAGKTAKAMTGLRTLDNADDLAELSKVFRDAYKPWMEGGRVGEIVYPATLAADLRKLLPTAKDLQQPGNFFARQLARTPETQVHISTNNLWVSMANILHGVDNADDAIRLLRTLSDAPQELIKGVTGLTSPAFVRIADQDGVVRWGAGVVSNPTLVREMPVFQAGTAKVLERMEKARDAAMEAAKKAGTRYDGTQQRVNPLELMVNLHAEWEKAARQMRGIVPLDPPTGATKLNLHDLADGTAQVEWLDDTDKVIKQMPAQPVEAARAQLATMQDALKTATENPLHKGLRVSAEIQRHIMSDMWLNLRPAHWVRNAAAFTLALGTDGLYSFKSIPEIFSDMGQKVVAGRMNYRAAEGSSGAGAMGDTSGTSPLRKIWPKNNPIAWLTEHGAKAWTGYGQLLNSIPVAEQAAYAHALDRGFTRIFGNEWATAAKQELGPLIQSWNVDPTVAKAILDKIVETGNIGSKADVAQVARQITHGAAEPFSLRSLKIPNELIPVDPHKEIVNIVNTLGRTTPGQAPETVQEAIQRASDEIKAVFQRLRNNPGAMLNEAMPQPTGEQVFDAVDDVARMVDDAKRDAIEAGYNTPEQLAIVEEEAQQYAQKLIQGETVGWEGVLDELANAPDNPAGMAATFDLLSQVYELKRMARQEVDELMQPIRAAKTPEQRNAAWAAKFKGTRDIYTQLADDLQGVFEENKDILRRIAAGEEIPQQRDWWDVIARYLDFDPRANLQTRGQEFGDMMQEDPATVQKFIDANRAYVDSSYIQLYDIFRRYPSMDGLDVLRMAQKQLDAEGARASAYLATQRARLKHYDEATKRVIGDLDKKDYYVIRNETWRAMFDNQVIFNQAAARAIAAHALAMDAPTQLTWTDDFFGGTFQLIGPAANDQIARAISLTIDDIFEAGAFDPATGKIADKYLAPKPIERIQQGKPKKGKGKAVWTITPEETETYFKALAVAGVTEKRADGWYLLILNEDAAQQAIAERGKFAWLARNVETGQLEVFGSPNPMAPLSEGGSSARVPANVMDDFGALVEGRPFAAAPSPAAAPPSGGMTLTPDGSGGTFPAEAPFVDTGKPGRPYTPPDAATPETPGPAPTPGAPDVTVAPENVVPAPLPVQNLDDLPVVDSYSRPWPTVPQEVLDAKAVQSSPALWEEAVDAEIAKATPVEERPADVIPDVLPPGMTPQEYGDRRATLDALQQADEAERSIAQEIVIDPDAVQPMAAAPEPAPAPVATPAPTQRPPVTVTTLNQLANGAGIATSKADGAPTHRHLINAINADARKNNAGWQLPTRTIVNSKGKPIQVTTDADFRAWVTAQPEQAQQAAEWLAVRVENAAKLAAEPKPAAATKVAKQPKPKKGKAAAQPAPAPAYMPDAAQDVDFMAPLPKKIQERMGSEGNAYMEARRNLPPGGSGGTYWGEVADAPPNPWAETLAPYARSVDEMKASGSVPAMMTRQMKTHLADLDYTQAEIGAMGPEDAWSALHDAYVQATTVPPRAPFADTGKPGRARPTPAPEPAAAPSPAGAQPEPVADDMFIRQPTAAEKVGGTARQRGFNTIESREGYEVVYKPFGNAGEREGQGYYYRRIEPAAPITPSPAAVAAPIGGTDLSPAAPAPAQRAGFMANADPNDRARAEAVLDAKPTRKAPATRREMVEREWAQGATAEKRAGLWYIGDRQVTTAEAEYLGHLQAQPVPSIAAAPPAPYVSEPDFVNITPDATAPTYIDANGVKVYRRTWEQVQAEADASTARRSAQQAQTAQPTAPAIPSAAKTYDVTLHRGTVGRGRLTYIEVSDGFHSVVLDSKTLPDGTVVLETRFSPKRQFANDEEARQAIAQQFRELDQAELAQGAALGRSNIDLADARKTFMADQADIKRTNAKKILETEINYSGNIQTRRENLEQSFLRGYRVGEDTENGKPVWALFKPDDSRHTITKTEADYFKHLEARAAAQAAPSPAAVAPGVGETGAQAAPDAIRKQIEFTGFYFDDATKNQVTVVPTIGFDRNNPLYNVEVTVGGTRTNLLDTPVSMPEAQQAAAKHVTDGFPELAQPAPVAPRPMGTAAPAEQAPPNIDRRKVNAADLAADYKARGMPDYLAWDEFVKDRSLRPDMNAKEFYALYRNSPAVPLEQPKAAPVEFVPTHRMQFEEGGPSRLIMMTERPDGSRYWVDAKGGTGGQLPGDLPDYIKPLQPAPSPAPATPGPNAITVTAPVIDAPVRQVELGELEGLPLATGEPMTAMAGAPAMPQNRDSFLRAYNAIDDQLEELDRQRYIYGSVNQSDYIRRMDEIDQQRIDLLLSIGADLTDDPTEAAARAFPDWDKLLERIGDPYKPLFREKMAGGEWTPSALLEEAFESKDAVSWQEGWQGVKNAKGNKYVTEGYRSDLIDALLDYRREGDDYSADKIASLLERAALDEVLTPESVKAFWPSLTKEMDEISARRAAVIAQEAAEEAAYAAAVQAPNLPAEVRQAWQMTPEEFAMSSGVVKFWDIDRLITPEITAYKKITKTDDLSWLQGALDDSFYGTPAKQKAAKAALDSIGVPRKQRGGTWKGGEIVDPHKFVVQKALEQGKPVPPDILALYGMAAPSPAAGDWVDTTGAIQAAKAYWPNFQGNIWNASEADFLNAADRRMMDYATIGEMKRKAQTLVDDLDSEYESLLSAGQKKKADALYKKLEAARKERNRTNTLLPSDLVTLPTYKEIKAAQDAQLREIWAKAVIEANRTGEYVTYPRYIERASETLGLGKGVTQAEPAAARPTPSATIAFDVGAPDLEIRFENRDSSTFKKAIRQEGDGYATTISAYDDSGALIGGVTLRRKVGDTGWRIEETDIKKLGSADVQQRVMRALEDQGILKPQKAPTAAPAPETAATLRDRFTELTNQWRNMPAGAKRDELAEQRRILYQRVLEAETDEKLNYGKAAPVAAPAPAPTPAPAPQPVTPAPAPAAQRSQALPTYVNEAGETVVVTPTVTPVEKAATFVRKLREKYNVNVDEARVLQWQNALETADTRREEMMARRRALFDEKIKAKGRQEIDALAEQIAALDLEMKPFDEAIIEAQGEITEIFRIADANKLHARWRAMSPRDRVLEELEYAVTNRNTKSDRSLATFNIPEAIKRIKDNPDLPVVELTVPVPGKTATDVLGKAEQDAIKANLKEAQALLSSNRASAVTINYGRWHITVLDPIQAQELAKGLGTRLSASVPTYSGITPSSGGFAGILEDSEKMPGFQNIEIWENAVPMQGRTMAPNTAILENVASKYKLGKPIKTKTFAGAANGATWYSDGYAMFGVKPKDWNGATFDPLNNPNAHQELVTTAAKSDLPLEPLGLVNYDSIPVIVLGTDDGKIKFINAKYYAGAMQAAGGKPVKWATASKKSQPIVAFVDGKPLSIIMPMAGEQKKIDQVAKYFYPTSDAGMLTLYGGFGAVDPIPAMTDIYNTLIKYWRKPKQPEIGDVALHQVTSLNDAEDRILAALPRMAQPKRNNLTAAQANALIDAIDKRLLPAFDDAVSRATYGAERMADTAMLNYRDRRGIDANLALILPYHYFYTRGGATWLRRIARKPSTANMYYDLQKAIETENAQSGVPARFKGTIPLWSYPGGQIRMANPMNSMLPWYMYMPEPFQQQEGDSDAEKMWTAIRSMTPGMMPVFDVAAAALFDQIDPLPDGASRVARYTNLRNYVPLAGMASDIAMATTGTVTPPGMGGDPFDPYRIKTAAAFMEQEGEISAEVAEYVIQLSLNLQQPGTDAWANIPDDQAAAVSAAYLAAGQRAGRDKLGMGGGLGYFAGVNFYNMPDAERELRSAQDLWRYVGYSEDNPSGSAAQRQAVMAQTPALGAFMARTTQPGSPYQPGQQAQAGALYDQLDPLYAQQAAIEDKLITQSGGGVSGGALYDATAKIRQEADALRAKYPDVPGSSGRFLSGSNPAEMAEKIIRMAVPDGGPAYPAEGASKAQMAAYYDARSAWEKEKLATFQRNLNTIIAGGDPMQDEINFELFQLMAGKDAPTLLREYGAGYYDSPTKRAYDTRNDVRNREEAAKYDAAEALILQQFGPAGLDVYKTYSVTEDADKQAYKAVHPELKALNFAAYNPNEYGQALALFGKDAILAWAKLPPSDGSEAASKARGEYYDANPGAYLMNAWMNGRPTPYGETRGPWASLPEEWGMEYQNNYGKDFAEAAKKFGDDIWQIAAGYKRGWSSSEKGAYFDKYPQLGDFFDWWNELLPDDGKSSSKGSSKGYSSYKKYYKSYSRRSYGRRSYGGYSRGYGGGGWGSSQWADDPKPVYIDDVRAAYFNPALWNTESELRRWYPARADDNLADAWRPAKYWAAK